MLTWSENREGKTMASQVTFQNHPFTNAPRTKPFLITRKEVAPFIFPNPDDFIMDFSDISYMYLSTEEITCSAYDIGPGGRVEPPDYHPGDEVYIVLEGTLTMLNTEAGQVVQVQEGESLLMPMGAKHSGYNFEQSKVRTMAFLAPKIFSEEGFPTDEAGKKKILNGKMSINDFPKYEILVSEPRAGILDDLGNWPINGPESRRYPLFHHIPESKKLLAISGTDNPILMKICVSNDFLTVAQLIIPSGGKGARMSDPDSHPYESVLYLDKGKLSVLIHDTLETFQLHEREALYIPKEMTYQLFNYENHTIEALICAKSLY
jgi:mannose-6-phosphate isomerase-like protein (cupin superfamily)